MLQEFWIAILIAFFPSGQVAFEAVPVQTQAECVAVLEQADLMARLQFEAGTQLRLECISSSEIGGGMPLAQGL